jgi:hypothetical protein
MSAWRSSLRSACQNRGDDGVRVARDAPTRSCRCFRQSPKAARPVAVLPPPPRGSASDVAAVVAPVRGGAVVLFAVR